MKLRAAAESAVSTGSEFASDAASTRHRTACRQDARCSCTAVSTRKSRDWSARSGTSCPNSQARRTGPRPQKLREEDAAALHVRVANVAKGRVDGGQDATWRRLDGDLAKNRLQERLDLRRQAPATRKRVSCGALGPQARHDGGRASMPSSTDPQLKPDQDRSRRPGREDDIWSRVRQRQALISCPDPGQLQTALIRSVVVKAIDAVCPNCKKRPKINTPSKARRRPIEAFRRLTDDVLRRAGVSSCRRPSDELRDHAEESAVAVGRESGG